MADLNATELATRLDLSKARISQYVSSGKLDGCYVGDGRARRFDLGKVAAALGKKLDLGQMTGNGLTTRRALRKLADDDAPPAPAPIGVRNTDGELERRDPDRLELATLQIKEEEARRRRRDNERDEGRWVLAEEVERHTARVMSQEVGRFELVLRDGARLIADRLGVDYRSARALLMETWRDHRASRAPQLVAEGEAATMTAAEMEADT